MARLLSVAGALLAGVCLACAASFQTGHAATYRVQPDGGGDFATIQDALDAAVGGDQVVLADGIYTGDRNRDLDFRGKAVTLRSESGDPARCVLFAEGTVGAPHRGVHFHSGETEATRIVALTISGGSAEYGGAILVEGASPYLESVVLTGNAAVHGGALARIGGVPVVQSATITGNRAQYGGGVYTSGYGPMPSLHFSILWGNCGVVGREVYLDHGALGLYCCCFGFPGFEGDGVIGYDDQWFFDDPRFCAPAICESAPFVGGDYSVSAESPCVPSNNECHSWVGALRVGCSEPTRVESTSWGRVKAVYARPGEARRVPARIGAVVLRPCGRP